MTTQKKEEVVTSTESNDISVDVDLHVRYVLSLESKTRNTDVMYFTDHKRLSGVYWAISSLYLLDRMDALPSERIITYVRSCRREDGSYGGNSDQDGHVLYTLSALQIHALYSVPLSDEEASKTAAWVAALQNQDGSFAGDEWGEIDTRFTYCALACLRILGFESLVNFESATEFCLKCANFDGAFGCIPGAESHAGNTFCSVAALALTKSLDKVDVDTLGWWLCERQLECGGLNGRPDKKEDVCYSWWVLASLRAIERDSWINGDKLALFIGECADEQDGGFADRPGDMADVFHTFFALGGLALLGKAQMKKDIDPVLALPVEVVKRLPLVKSRDDD